MNIKIIKNSNNYFCLDTISSILGIGDWFEGLVEVHYSSSERKINLLNTTDLVFYFSDTSPVTVHKRFNQ